MSMDRRSFLAAIPGAALAAKAAEGARLFAPRPALDRVGVQIYTLRSALQADLDGTLEALAEIGYDELELFGPYSMAGRELRAKLDGLGLRAASSHVAIEAVRDNWDAVLESAQELGQTQIVVPFLGESERTPDGIRRVADDLNRAGESARAAGMRVGYHNHGFEIEPGANGERLIDILLAQTDPDLVDWQMDIYWTVDAGADALAELARHGSRIRSVHVKDQTADGEMTEVGSGVIDFGAILGRAEGMALRHQFVEHDWPDDPIESVRKSYAAVKALG